ncbi:RCC1 domain-containing protein [Candidatus Riflebacteria bacterium]
MNRNYFYTFIMLTALMIIGCNILSSDDDDAPAVTTQEVTMSGKVEFPETAGTLASIRAKVDFTKYRVYINGVRVTLNDDGTYSGDVPEAEEYVIEVRFAGSPKAVLKATASKDDEGKEVKVDVKTTAHTLAYEAFKQQTGKSDKNFKDFAELVDEADEAIEKIAESIEKVLQSVSNLESEDLDLENNEEIKSNTEEATKKAEEEEAKQATSTTTTSSTTTSTTAVDTTTTSSSTSSTTAVELPAGTLAINDGAASTDSVNVILNLTVTQAVGVVTMSVDGGDFEALNQAKSHTLSSGDGEKTVTIILKDENGQSSDITDTITLDTTPVVPAWNGKVILGDAHALWLKTDHTVWGQGFNSDGVLGDNTTTTRNDWVQVGVQGQIPAPSIRAGLAALTDIGDIAAGAFHSLAMKSDGSAVYGWGQSGQWELGTTTSTLKVPALISGITDVKAIAAGGQVSLALKTDGTVYSWGYGSFGQLGWLYCGSAPSKSKTPTQVTGLSDVKAIAAGKQHCMALKSDGTVYTWGKGTFGQLGWLYCGGAPSQKNTPTLVPGLSDISHIAAGYYHNLALKSDGSTVYAWGRNQQGELGLSPSDASQKNTPMVISGITDVTSITAGYVHSVVQKSNGSIWGFGNNNYGQIEKEWPTSGGTFSSSNTPIQITVSDVLGFDSGYGATIFIFKDDVTRVYGNVQAGD